MKGRKNAVSVFGRLDKSRQMCIHLRTCLGAEVGVDSFPGAGYGAAGVADLGEVASSAHPITTLNQPSPDQPPPAPSPPASPPRATPPSTLSTLPPPAPPPPATPGAPWPFPHPPTPLLLLLLLLLPPCPPAPRKTRRRRRRLLLRGRVGGGRGESPSQSRRGRGGGWVGGWMDVCGGGGICAWGQCVFPREG